MIAETRLKTLVKEIETLPADAWPEIQQFVAFLRFKHHAAPETLGWPPDFFARTAGSIPDFPDIAPEGAFETREALP